MKHQVAFTMKSLVLLLSVVVSAAVAQAVELTDQTLKSARRIILIPGTYDPINNGHLEMAKKALQEWNGDLAILLPNSKPFHKVANPLVVRQRLIAQALKSEPQIAVSRDLDTNLSRQSEEGSRSFDSRVVSHIRSVNPEARIALAVGEDVAGQSITRFTLEMRTHPDEILIASRPSAEVEAIARVWKGPKTTYVSTPVIETSSTAVRKILRENVSLYFSSPEERVNDKAYQELVKIIPEVTANEILNSGLYLDRAVGGSVPTSQKLKLIVAQALRRLAAKFNLYEDVKSEMVSRVAKKEAVEIEIGDRTYRSIRYLGSGLSADAFLLDMDGTKVVAKVARESEKSRQSVLRSIPIHLWVAKKLGMNVPKLVGYDPEGRWLLTEFVEGPSLAKYIEQNDGVRGEVRRSVLELHEKVGQMLDRSSVNLDLAPDNVIVRDGKAYLVDLGPILATDLYFPPATELLKNWETKYTKPEVRKGLVQVRTCEAIF